MPKELLPLFDRPVIHYLVEELVAVGISEVVIVARPGTEAVLRSYFSRDPEWDRYLAERDHAHLLQPLHDLLEQIRFSFVQQLPDQAYGSGAPVLVVRDRLNAPFVYLYGDDVILERRCGESLRTLLAIYERQKPAAVVGACQVPHERISAVGSIAYRPGTDCEVAYILEKPKPEQAPSQFTPIGRQVLSPAIIQVLEEQQTGLQRGQELQMTGALSTLARSERVLAPQILGQWVTTGDASSLLEASQAASRMRLDQTA
jgi:UTP--glucose-1-phosphate uridylyltransferase